jgi:myo-inositol-1(or 4)-monophosphatase
MTDSYAEILPRIEDALRAAQKVFDQFSPGAVEAEFKAGHDPVTEADRTVDSLLRRELLREGEGWLSEESVDDFTRLEKSRVWVVDPLDGTREFVAGIPEFCVSVALIDNGRPIAGGICNPVTHETFLGSVESGVTYNSRSVRTSEKKSLRNAEILASRSELNRGEWNQFGHDEFHIRPMGSVAYKLALVSAGLSDATFTLVPKHEWDIAAGVALVLSNGGFVRTLDDRPLRFNQPRPLVSGLIACGAALAPELISRLELLPPRV